jgi:histidyl-tRNA synthetase
VYSLKIFMNIRSIKGMNDVFDPEIHIWRFAETQARAHFENFGYTEIKTPIVESTTLFTRTVGDTTDIVNKEMYTFSDRNEESITLRPEGTAPVVRALVEHNLINLDPVQKLYYWGPMFRYERPQKGRYRQFNQYGLEVFGIANARIDSELIAMLTDFYTRLGLQNLTVRVSSLGCDECRPSYREVIIKLLTPSKDILCADCKVRLEKNPLRILDCKVPTCKEIASRLPSSLDFLCKPCHEHFDALRDDLIRLKTPFIVDKSLVRGFDYYNRTVFEITTNDLGSQNAVGGGGRYDKLVGDLGGPACPAVGYAGGVERLILLLGLQQKNFAPKLSLFFVLPDDRGKDIAFTTAYALRNQGVRVEIDYTGKSMKSQMKRADKLKAENVLILGGSEVDQGIAILRNMSTKVQENINLNELEKELLGRFK